LLAIDGSRFSKAAMRAVVARSRLGGTQVRVLHVVEPPSLLVAREMGGYDPAMDAVWEAETKRAESLVAKTAKAFHSKGVKVTTSVEQGDPKSKILEAASKWHADLIVVGARGKRGLARFLMGSVSEGVARHASCSVEIVRVSTRRRASPA
jgi:nucleotide-binding universal stress UspA family protein